MPTNPTPQQDRPFGDRQQPGSAFAAPSGSRQPITDDSQLPPLLNAVATGDRGALASIYDQVVPVVLVVVRSLVESEEAAECVIIDTFSHVWRQAPQVAGTNPNVLAWVLTLAVQCARDDRRIRVHGM